jgi:hypothetical protein
MEIDEKIILAKGLIAQREEIDQKLSELFTGELSDRKERRCSVCHEVGHQARTCPTKPKANGVDAAL